MLNDVLSSEGFKVELIIFINNSDGCVVNKKAFHILKSNYAALHSIPHRAEYSPLEGSLKLTTISDGCLSAILLLCKIEPEPLPMTHNKFQFSLNLLQLKTDELKFLLKTKQTMTAIIELFFNAILRLSYLKTTAFYL
ncbi:MAG: hypothetical protein K8H86_00630 [Ignavibacteriaceae bacterium]|nr:hypothetical protein [Ignavibacteriaceae bacterium]